MDINSLLSPSEAPAQGSQADASPKNIGRRRAPTSAVNQSPVTSQSPTPQQVATSKPAHHPLPAHIQIPPMSPSRHAAIHQQWANVPSPAGSSLSASGTYSPRSFSHSQTVGVTPPPKDQARTQQQQQRPSLNRGPPSGMDTLADLASMQHHQQTSGRPNIPQRQNSGVGASSARPSIEQLKRAHSGSRGSIDMSMLDTAPKPPVHQARDLFSASLSSGELQEANQLLQHLFDSPHAYKSHLQLTRLLRKGLRKHALDETTGQIRRDPRTYELAKELQEANEAMNKLFAIGEELWLERLYDQQLLAHTVDDCMTVMELCQKAVSEEPGSTALWQTSGKWMTMIYRYSHDLEVDLPAMFETRFSSWSDDEKLVAREFFHRQQAIDIWRAGSQDTMYNLFDSHLIWDNYMELLLEDLRQERTDRGLTSVRDLYERRLQVPHKQWEQTFQHFSQFVSNYLQPSAYEQTMVRIKQMSQLAKLQYDDRDQFEAQWHHFKATGDEAAEGRIVSEYLEWELGRSRKKRGHFSFDLCRALYIRALLRFPLYTDLWEEFILFLADELSGDALAQQILPVINRSTSHCPWSGMLWAHYIRAGELVDLSFEEMSQIKHRATSKGLLDSSPIEEHIVINTNWCSYLRRTAFARPSPEEDELDVTEVGIRSALEEMEVLGRQRHGKDYQGDPQYRLERIYIRFCTQVGDGVHIQTARDTWKSLIPRCGRNYEFWQWYFLWERFIWVKNPGNRNASPNPKEATKVLVQGIENPELDWPEKLIDDLLRHSEDYEDPEGQLMAIVTARKARKAVETRRALERTEAAQYQQPQATVLPERPSSNQADLGSQNAKRKRDEAEETTASKKAKSAETPDDVIMSTGDQSAGAAPKRDRENATVTIKNLPASVSEGQLRHFLRECGTINSVQFEPEADDVAEEASKIAHVEFDNSEDVLVAQTRDMKTFQGRVISVQVGTGTTLYCANYPATSDEKYIRSLFEPFGKVLQVRFPSLKYNTHRRFCYVQFSTSGEAHTASAQLDGKEIAVGEDGSKINLIAKLSDPSHKKTRSGALEEGRELHVGNVDWGVGEAELHELFGKYGDVERVRVPRNIAGKSKGMAFVVFARAEQANKALVVDGSKIRTRIVTVSLATKDHAKRTATTVITRARSSGSPSPSVSQAVVDVGTDPIRHAEHGGMAREEITSKTVALLNVPDTVNDARIRSIAEPYGALTKIVLRPDHGGAIVEFVEVSGAGKASMALEGFEISPGRRIQIGTVQQLMASKAETKRQERVTSSKKNAIAPAPGGLGSGVIRRPAQGAGRRGGLGMKRGGGGVLAASTRSKDGGESGNTTASNSAPTNSASQGGSAKSNADFRAMFS